MANKEANEIEKIRELLGIISQLVAYVDANEKLLESWKPANLLALSPKLREVRKSLGLGDK